MSNLVKRILGLGRQALLTLSMAEFDRPENSMDQPRVIKPSWRRLWRETPGSAAVEFAFVAPFFFFMLLETFQVGLSLFYQGILDSATQTAARQIRTGAVQNGAYSFQTLLCSNLASIMSCSNLKYGVQYGSTFAGLSSLSLVTYSAGNPPTITYPAASQYTAVTVQYSVNFPLNNFTLTSVAVFKAEGF